MSSDKLKTDFAKFAMRARGHSVWWHDRKHREWSWIDSKSNLPVDDEKELFGFSLAANDNIDIGRLEQFSELLSGLEYFEFVRMDFRGHRLQPISNLKHLRFAKFSQCVLTVDAIDALADSTKLQYLIIAGGAVDQSILSAIQQLSHVRCIIFFDVDADLKSLNDARKHMDSLVLSYRKNENRTVVAELPPAKLPYKLDLQAGKQIQDSMKAIKEILSQRGMTDKHKFRDPASQEELTALEEQIGLQLPLDVQSLLKSSNGQSEFDSLVCLAPFFGTKEIASSFFFRLEFGISELYFHAYRDQTGDWHRLGIPIMGADALTVFVDPLTGQVCCYDVPSGQILTKDLQGLVSNLHQQVRHQLIDEKEEDLVLHTQDLATDGESCSFG